MALLSKVAAIQRRCIDAHRHSCFAIMISLDKYNEKLFSIH
jgi:hypothetical protein